MRLNCGVFRVFLYGKFIKRRRLTLTSYTCRCHSQDMANIRNGTPERDLSPEDQPPVVLEQQKLDPTIQDYIMALAAHGPFAHDLKTTRPHVLAALAEIWPHLTGWEKQEEELLKSIRDVLVSTPASASAPAIFVRISITSAALIPTNLPEPEEAVIIISFDGKEGVMKSCTIPASAAAVPTLRDMAVPTGLIVMGQPMAATAPVGNNPLLEFGVDQNFYGTRVRDRVLRGDASLKGDDTSIAGDNTPYVAPRPYLGDPREENKRTGERAKERGAMLLALGAIGGESFMQNTHVAVPYLRPRQQEPRREEAAESQEQKAEQGEQAENPERRGEENHERRTDGHERRMPGRLGYFNVDENAGTEGLTPPEREVLAIRAEQGTGAARQEAEATRIEQEDRKKADMQLSPHRPEMAHTAEEISPTPAGTVETTTVHAPAEEQAVREQPPEQTAGTQTQSAEMVRTASATEFILPGISSSGQNLTPEQAFPESAQNRETSSASVESGVAPPTGISETGTAENEQVAYTGAMRRPEDERREAFGREAEDRTKEEESDRRVRLQSEQEQRRSSSEERENERIRVWNLERDRDRDQDREPERQRENTRINAGWNYRPFYVSGSQHEYGVYRHYNDNPARFSAEQEYRDKIIYQEWPMHKASPMYAKRKSLKDLSPEHNLAENP